MAGKFVVVDEGAFEADKVVFSSSDQQFAELKAMQYNDAMVPAQRKFAVYELVKVKPSPAEAATLAREEWFAAKFPQSAKEVQDWAKLDAQRAADAPQIDIDAAIRDAEDEGV